MSIFVDDPVWPYRGMLMCHMLTDGSLDELHAMADKIGVSRRHFQWKPGRTPHYDICKSKRALAMKFGAVEIDRAKTVEIMRLWRQIIR